MGKDRDFIRHLAENAKNIEEFLDATSAALFVYQGSGFRYVNPPCERLTGYDRDELLGMNFWFLVHPDFQEYVKERGFARQRGELPPSRVEFKIVTKGGEERWVDFSARTIEFEGKGAGLGTAYDITDRKRDEEAIRRAQMFFTSVVENIPHTIFIKEVKNLLYVYVNRACAEFLGRTSEDLVGKTDHEIFPKENAELFRSQDREMLRNRALLDIAEETVLTPHRGARVMHTRKIPLVSASGEPEFLVGIAEDITEHKKADEALRRWRDIFFRTKMAIVVSAFDSDRLDLVNPAFAEQHGYAVEEITGRPIADVYPPELRAAFPERIRAAKERGHVAFETLHLRKDGSVFPALVDLTVATDADSTFRYRIANVYDLTERKRTEEALLRSEEQLRQSQKMEAMGRLAGGVAHDFNNILTVITGYSDLLLHRLGPQDPRRREMEEIRKAADRAAALTSQLLAFSRKQVMQPQVIDLNAVVSNLDKMLRRLIGEDIVLNGSLGEGLWRVKADPGQIEQVLVNLVVNARDAMPGGGNIAIETANVIAGEGDIPGQEEVPPGPYVMLGVSDTGCGMDAETRSHLFEPFFTTKETGKGTGLGLATVYGIVKQSGGFIAVTTEVDLGTAFRIYLPRAGAADGSGRAENLPSPLLEGRETILLVEDDEVVRTLVRKILAGQGYSVLEVPRPEEVLDVCDRHAGAVDLLVTDVVMPGMSGREVADLVQPRYPGMKVLFMSGYTDDAIVRHGVLSGSKAFLQKPFTPEGLARKVREVLDGARPG